MHCRIKDLDLYYEIAGEGMPVVMVHGMGVDHQTMRGCMEPVFAARDQRWKRVYLDLPGMGRTEGRDWIGNSDDMVWVVSQLIDSVIPGERFLLVGESYGGYLVRALIRERPQDVEGMLLIAPLAVADDAQRDLPPRSVWRREAAFLETLEPEERDLFDLFIVNQNQANWIRFQNEILAGFGAGDQAFKTKIRNRIENYALSYDVDDMPEPYDKPSLIVTGRQDCLAGYRDQWTFLENYPHSTFAVLDRAGHGMQIEQAGLFNALVHEWLDRVIDPLA
jgi:pimeloyl-ACP methyl ester carboxylesterase